MLVKERRLYALRASEVAEKRDKLLFKFVCSLTGLLAVSP
jgi:hypothetical protein